ncbi:DUF368 domain-containing protein [Sesbania bispinosa]|nr:DUF368 domain-containing protein [Sesbania bispinosa]
MVLWPHSDSIGASKHSREILRSSQPPGTVARPQNVQASFSGRRSPSLIVVFGQSGGRITSLFSFSGSIALLVVTATSPLHNVVHGFVPLVVARVLSSSSSEKICSTLYVSSTISV